MTMELAVHSLQARSTSHGEAICPVQPSAAQDRWQKPADDAETMAMAQIRWQETDSVLCQSDLRHWQALAWCLELGGRARALVCQLA